MNIYFACSITGGRQDESAYQAIVDALLAAGHEVPTAGLSKPEILSLEHITAAQEVYTRDTAWIEGCDALVVATEWEEFKKLDLQRAKAALTHPIMFDGRNLFDPAEMERLGFIYKSIGR